MEYRPFSRVTRRATTPRVVWLGLRRYSRPLRPSGLTSLRSPALERQMDDETTRPDKPSFRIVPAQGRELHLHFLHVSLEAHPQQPGLAFREKTLLTKTFRPRAQRAAKADRPLTACHHLLDLRSRKTQAGQGFDRLRADGTKHDLEARHRFHPGTESLAVPSARGSR